MIYTYSECFMFGFGISVVVVIVFLLCNMILNKIIKAYSKHRDPWKDLRSVLTK